MGLFTRADRKGPPFDLLVIGLGNPGAEYERSRHNVGAECVALLASRHGTALKASKEKSLTAEITLRSPDGPLRVALAFPLTFMNESGQAAQLLVRRYGIEEPGQIIVVQDELDLPPAVVRLKNGGGLAGHNGLRSLTQHLKTQDYLRIRIGVGKPPSKDAGANHVLKKVPKIEREHLDIAVQVAADAVESIAARGFQTTMTEVNARPAPE
jgi:peptidyl-tRNA hydrolase, PTH1 family